MKREESRSIFNDLMLGDYDFDAIYKFAKQLMEDGPTAEEVKGFVDAIRDRAGKLNPELPASAKTIDISGSGGDKIKTINVGSISSLVLAAAGLVVGKSSTRAYTGKSGSKDLFDGLGIPIDLANQNVKEKERLLEKTSFAAYYYPAMSPNYGTNNGRFMMELKERGLSFITPWHVAAWLYNPLKLNYRIYGMFTDKYFQAAAEVLKSQGVEKGWILHGVDGLDEISNVGETRVFEFSKSGDKAFSLQPEDFGIKRAKKEDITITSVEKCFKIAENIIEGKESSPHNDLVLINSAGGLYLTGLAESLKEGVKMADELLKSGKVKAKLEEIKAEIRK